MEDAKTCPVCLSPFTDPQLLSCHHNVCLSCTQDNITNNNNCSSQNNNTKKPEKEIKPELQNDVVCALCNSSTPVTELKLNIGLKNMMEAHTGEKKGTQLFLIFRPQKKKKVLKSHRNHTAM